MTQQNALTAPNGRSGFSLAPTNIAEAMQLADLLSRSALVPKDYIGNPSNIIVAIQWGAEIGLSPLQAMQNISVINGRPSLWGDAVLALVQGSGLLESIHEDVSATEATCKVKRIGSSSPVTRTFSMEDAKRAGLAGKQGPWQQYPKRMLQMRARSWAIRDCFADVLKGVQVREELQDIPREINMGEAEVVRNEAPPAPPAPTTRGEAVRVAMSKRAKAAPAAQESSLKDVLTAIDTADTLHALEGVGAAAAALPTDEDRKQARAAYRARKKAIEALIDEAEQHAQSAIDSQTGEITQPQGEVDVDMAEHADFIAGLQDGSAAS